MTIFLTIKETGTDEITLSELFECKTDKTPAEDAVLDEIHEILRQKCKSYEVTK